MSNQEIFYYLIGILIGGVIFSVGGIFALLGGMCGAILGATATRLLPPGRLVIGANRPTLDSFTDYCEQHPELRFWQALRAWSGHEVILVKNGEETEDTFFYTGKDK